MLLSEKIKITKVANPQAAGTSDVQSAILDMAGCHSVVFLSSFAVGAVDNFLRVEEGDESDGSDMAPVADGFVSPGSSDEDQWVDFHKPWKRYIRCVAERDTETAIGDIWALQYGLRSWPADNVEAGTITGVQTVSPAEIAEDEDWSESEEPVFGGDSESSSESESEFSSESESE